MTRSEDDRYGARPGSERYRDEQRANRGPVYHGRDWKDADGEAGREALRIPAEEEGTPVLELADEAITDPGTRGAVFGRDGKGIVAREDFDRNMEGMSRR
ncbi:MAG TPA: hypothetical protein VM734_24730 [Kofleriaceae bacterium]|jgi:hypothetical protein|nr:hypothetical protein [Kofleriaceae bacterium]